MPKYHVFRRFIRGLNRLLSMSPEVWKSGLRNMGIEEGSDAELSLIETVKEGTNVLEVTLYFRDYPEVVDDPVALKALQLEFTRHRVRGFRRVYKKLAEDLEKDGFPTDHLDNILETSFREGISIVSSPTPEYEYFEAVAEFEN